MTNSKKQEPVQDAAIACAAGHSKTGDTDSTISLDMDGDATPPLLGNDRASGDDHVELEQGAGGYLVFTAACAVLSAFLFGWNIGVVNTTQRAMSTCEPGRTVQLLDLITLPACIPMTNELYGVMVSTFALGGLVGGSSGGHLARWIGRRGTLLYNNAVFIVAALMMALSEDVAVLCLGRFVVGVACGVATAAAPMYLAEISPNRLRGTFGAVHQLAVVIGILVSQLASLPVDAPEWPIPTGKYIGWRLLFAFTLVPALLQAFLLSFLVESPRHLVSLGDYEQARRAVQKLRGQLDVESEIEHLISVHERDVQLQQQAVGLKQLCTQRQFRRPLLISVVAMLSQQLSGINAVMQFSTDIFSKVMGAAESARMTVIVGVVNLFATILAVYLMDRAGRRVLFLTSQFGMGVACVVIVIAAITGYDVVLAGMVVAYVALFAIGLGPIPWMIMPEIFQTSAIGAAATIGNSTNWLSNYAVSLFFPVISKLLGYYTFLPFAVFNLALGAIMFWILPETKGKSIDQVVRMLGVHQ